MYWRTRVQPLRDQSSDQGRPGCLVSDTPHCWTDRATGRHHSRTDRSLVFWAEQFHFLFVDIGVFCIMWKTSKLGLRLLRFVPYLHWVAWTSIRTKRGAATSHCSNFVDFVVLNCLNYSGQPRQVATEAPPNISKKTKKTKPTIQKSPLWILDGQAVAQAMPAQAKVCRRTGIVHAGRGM